MVGSQSYLRATELAGRILHESGVSAFPLNPVFLARQAGVKIVPYAQFAALSALRAEELLAVSEDGFSTCVDSQYFIVYNPAVQPRSRRRWTLLHEYCHIRLGHVPEDGALLPGGPNERALEAAADQLTACLIAPLPLAFLCRIEGEEALARCFGLSGRAAANIFRDYQTYRRSSLSPALGYGEALGFFCRFAMDYLRRQEREASRRHYRMVDIDA